MAALAALALALALAACARSAPPAPVVDPRGARAAEPRPESVRVAPGETLYGVARRWEVPIRALIEENRLEPPYGLVAGSRLDLPQVRVHRVAPGETLYAISRRYGVDLASLARANDLAPPYTIRHGTMLLLPEAPVAAPAPQLATAPAPPRPAASALPEATEEARSPPRPRPPPRDPVPPSRSGFLWPVEGRVLAGFGAAPGGTHNDGINIAAPAGTPIRAAADGVVAYAGNELRGFGNLILVKHAEGWMSAYAHCERILVRRGARVRRGEEIGRVGSTGGVAEPQLHFELRRGAAAIDPVGELPPAVGS
jgi:murein DD-endopeptidase MepM/ murein hydrolase activator NlpD